MRVVERGRGGDGLLEEAWRGDGNSLWDGAGRSAGQDSQLAPLKQSKRENALLSAEELPLPVASTKQSTLGDRVEGL